MNREEDRREQRGKRRSKRWVVVLMAGLMGCCGSFQDALGQYNQPMSPHPSAPWGNGPVNAGDPSPDTMEGMMAARSRIQRNADRQKHLMSDTERLVALADELKQEAASSGTETMTPEMQRKIAEIEKLARSVKDKMRE
jgi:hypothetical protein